ncbi:L,D-transpeptidase family protein [Pikeienuella piscinae]|uniref:L,D-transpeptidase family protein n=1 Tax=Pikeienuella piscinae TaxID=2748098 RepID=A0A7L5BSU9_9RHOB|nr:L,D-transpeptidase family protein [Pikeienuella piscinae]QIE54425.1 L,D-transpeptidase family protein [Pikeienuella piscinae]
MRRISLTPLVGLALLLLAGCAPPPQAEAPAPEPAPALTPVSSMQVVMDRFNVPFRTPLKGKAILVNIPSFELIAIEDGEEVFRSKVIVGAPGGPDTETPLVDTWVSVVRFRPTWRPTPTMVRSGEYQARTWPAGKGNPLGLAAIRLQPGMLIYLHDTNRKKLFERDMRALSHGCVRVERWDEVIAWLQGIDIEEVHQYANGRRTFDMPADPVPVYFRYYRAFPDSEGRLRTFDDVYGIGPSTDPFVSGARATIPTPPA